MKATTLLRLRRGLVSFLATGSIAMGLAVAPAGASHGGPGSCPTVKPTSELTAGTVATGYTVSRGTVPETFSAEILGVLPDGIGPGRDMIVVEADSPAIEKAGGIWFGMSGSPVYVDGQLIGALAYGLTWGPSNIAGLTPAQDLVNLANRPETTPQASPRRVELSPRLVRAIARASGRAAENTSDTMRLMKSPLSVSGVGVHRLDIVAEAIGKEKLALLPYAGSSASSAPAPTSEIPEPGGNFAAVASYGDVSFAGIGTTSYVCSGKAVAFGHSFFGLPVGDAVLGANLADAITVVDDEVYGPFKLATVAGTLGLLDQDRFAGVRSLLGETFPLIPLTSTVLLEDGSNSQDGDTHVVDQEFVPFATFIHLLSNIDFARDEIGAGSSSLSWDISGTREGGAPWTLQRSNMYASDFDISYESLFELEQQLYSILSNGFEDITFTDVDVDATVGDVVRRYTLSSFQVRKRGEYVETESIRAYPGKVLSLRAVLTPEGGSADKIVDFKMQIPTNARNDHFIKIGGGGRVGRGFAVDEQACFTGSCRTSNHVPKADSFDELLSILSGAPHNNDLVAILRGARRQRKDVFIEPQEFVVDGVAVLYIRVSGGPSVCCSEPVPAEG